MDGRQRCHLTFTTRANGMNVVVKLLSENNAKTAVAVARLGKGLAKSLRRKLTESCPTVEGAS